MTDPKKESLDWGTDEKVLDPVHQERVPAIVTIENFRVLGMDPQDEEFYMGFSEERRKRVTRKVCFSFLFSCFTCNWDKECLSGGSGRVKVE